ncbi:phosphotransferase enzyme family protein [Dongia sp.]|uniref:phosphotransferase enzyme family protein n=1 Tax=Dongia sp. TaxID=1977262 RepID=UPI0035AE5C36
MTHPLTSAQLTPFITDLAISALPRWHLHGAEVKLINHSENWTFRVQPKNCQRPVILRVHRAGYHSLGGIRSELAWMRALQREAGVKTPQAIPGRDGADIQTVSHPALESPRHCVLFEFIDGIEPPRDDLIAPFRQLGEVTARCHNHSEQWMRPAYFDRLAWDFDHAVGAAPNWGDWRFGPDCTPDRAALIQRAVDLLARRLAAFGQARNRYGYIHADFRLANLLLHEGDVRVIDFDDSGLGWFLYDAATAVSFFETRADVPDLIEAWKDGYRRQRALSSIEADEIDSFILLRRLTLFAWMGSHGETDLARTEGPGYAEGSAELAEKYLTRFG